jgi:hypothetical protein
MMSIITQTANSQNLPNVLPDTGFVGVGTTTPSCNFQVIGQSQISGNLTVDSSITIADSARVDNNLRVNGHLFVAKNAYITDTTYTKALRVNRITTFPGDSIIMLGDSTLYLQPYLNTIYPSGIGLKGMGLGYGASVGKAWYSVAIGYRVTVEENATNSITIGSGTGGLQLKNSIPNTIMLGTNSNLPTLFLAPANGTFNSTGKVGIGTTTPGINYETPDQLKLDVNGDARFYRNNNQSNYLRVGYNTSNAIIDNFGQGSLMINYYSGKDVYIGVGNTKADVHIGKDLFVCGKGSFKELYISTIWCDFVFSSSYQYMSIKQKEDFYKLNHHLPNIPTALEVETKGANVGNSLKGILQNVEENRLDITLLYNMILDLQEENKKLKELLNQTR